MRSKVPQPALMGLQQAERGRCGSSNIRMNKPRHGRNYLCRSPFSVKRDALLERKKNNVTKDLFAGSDEGRTAKTLKYAQSVTFEAPLELEGDGVLPSVTVAYETYGRLSEAKAGHEAG